MSPKAWGRFSKTDTVKWIFKHAEFTHDVHLNPFSFPLSLPPTFVEADQYPLPKPEELRWQREQFTKLNLRQAHLQMELHQS